MLNYKRFIIAIISVIFFPLSSYAEGNDRSVIEYLTDNIVFQIIYSGGLYSFFTMVILTLISMKYEKFREIFLTILFAIFGLFLVVMMYEGYQDFRWITDY